MNIGEAAATIAKADAKAQALKVVSEILQSGGGANAASLRVAEQYVEAFSHLAKTNNTLILSNDVGDVAKSVAQVCY